jgi:hypothetical protein
LQWNYKKHVKTKKKLVWQLLYKIFYLTFVLFSVEALFRDGGVTGGQIRYSEFIDNIAQPVPDY